MTDNDIIKALELCGCDNYQCDNCPYAYKTCTVYKDSLDLINRQKAEIDKWKQRFINSECDATNLTGELIALSAERDSLKMERDDAIKEFATRLEEYSYESMGNYGISHMVVSVKDIDNLVKEMERDNNAE